MTLADSDLLSSLVDLLGPFKDVTLILSAETKVTISLVYVMHARLLDHLAKFTCPHPAVLLVRDTIKSDLSSRYSLDIVYCIR